MYFRREVDARLHCEMFDDCVVHHEAVGALAVIRCDNTDTMSEGAVTL